MIDSLETTMPPSFATENNVQDANAYVEIDRRLELPNCENVAQQLHDILASSLPSFYRSAYRVLGNTADAEDAVQDALLAAYKHLDQFRGKSHMSTWLTAIVRNCALMQLRRRPRRVHISLDERMGDEQEFSISETLADGRPSPEDECRNSELNVRVSKFATQLSPRLQRTFQLRDIDDLSINETAGILGVASGTVKAQLARARKKLRESMRRQRKSASSQTSYFQGISKYGRQ